MKIDAIMKAERMHEVRQGVGADAKCRSCASHRWAERGLTAYTGNPLNSHLDQRLSLNRPIYLQKHRASPRHDQFPPVPRSSH